MKIISVILLSFIVHTGIGQVNRSAINTGSADSILPVRPPFYNQIDSTRRQIAASTFFLPLYDKQFFLAGIEVNLPARKYGWFNSLSMHFTDSKSSHIVARHNRYFSVMAGKKYEWINTHTYFSVGLNVGGFWNYRDITTFKINTYGLAVLPNLEAGWSLRKVIIAVGGKFTVSGGYFESKYTGIDPVVFKFRSHGIEAFVEASPYVKILLR